VSRAIIGRSFHFRKRRGADTQRPRAICIRPCIPDLVLRTEAAPIGGAAALTVETMGFASVAYCSRNMITHRLMEATLRAPVLTDGFHFSGASDTR
jgi:hypothetical protein